MRGSWRIGRLMGIDIMVDISWFIIVLLMIYSLGFIEFPRELHPRAFGARADVVSVILGTAASLLLFASVLAHELSHSWMAIERGIPVTRITLFIFGGVAQIADEPDRPSTEFLIAIMGPLMSIALAAIFGAAWVWLQILGPNPLFGTYLTPLTLLCGILAQANGSLALFNLAPGFPLDGGRVFRAIVWAITKNVRTATRWATRLGQVIAVILIGIGGILFFVLSNGSGLWYAFIGLFLWNAAGQGYKQTLLLEALRSVTVGQLMTRVVETVPPHISLTEFIDQHLLPRRDQTFVVSDSTAILGIISLENIKRVKRSEWNRTRVDQAMTPSSNFKSLSTSQQASSALAQMAATNTSELPVIEDGRVVGFLGQDELSRFIKLKAELKD